MRSHCALYVDAGYLLASAATRLTGTSLRSGIVVDHERLIEAMIHQAETASGLPLLRVHWYDSARNGLADPVQERIGLLPRVKVRLGRVGFGGEQKGVDLRIGLDMVAHARSGAVELIFLVSGDDDLTEAVEEAQGHGVQVLVLAVPNEFGRPHAVSKHLQREADGVEVLEPATIDATVTRIVPAPPRSTQPVTPPVTRQEQVPTPTPTPIATPAMLAERKPVIVGTPPAPVSELVYSSATGVGRTLSPEYDGAQEEVTATIDGVAGRVLKTWMDSATSEQRDAVWAGRPSIPREVDRALLLDLSDALGVYDLSDPVRIELRARFWKVFEENLGSRG